VTVQLPPNGAATSLLPCIPTTGSPAYWQAQLEGFAIVRELRRTITAAFAASQYTQGEWDEDYGDFEPVENIGPWDRAVAAMEAARTHPYGARILDAWGVRAADCGNLAAVLARLRSFP